MKIKFRNCAICKRKYKPPFITNGRTCSKECSTELRKIGHTKHGQNGTRIHKIWTEMKQRCYNSQSDTAANRRTYQGIRVCRKWRNSFLEFYNWSIKNGYTDQLELDRKDPNGNYTPRNCRWVTKIQNLTNRRKRKGGTSVFKGVSRYSHGRWRSQIYTNGSPVLLGLFQTELEAARAYDKAAYALWGGFSRINFPETYNHDN